MAFENASGTESVSTVGVNVTLSTNTFFDKGYIENTGDTDALIYLNETSDVATKATKLLAGRRLVFSDLKGGGVSHFRHKTASSTTTLEYFFIN